MAGSDETENTRQPHERAGSDYDVAIVGGGPAGLSAAITLGRACRRVILFDHGKPRNYAAHAVHCYLGVEGSTPAELRERGRNQARSYGVVIEDAEVLRVGQTPSTRTGRSSFEIETTTKQLIVRALILATGMIDELPDIHGIKDFYGHSVHHCPYCDGWEHRGERLIALGKASSVTDLALTLRGWSDRVTVCTNGEIIGDKDRERLKRNDIAFRELKISRLAGDNGKLQQLVFEDDSDLECDALFFSSDQAQRSSLPAMLGCETDDEGQFVTGKKHCSAVEGVYLVGDADGDVQFAIVAAAEGAVAATAVDEALRKQDTK